MTLKIKKQIKNSDGTVTEIEGTEAEVEAFLRKQEKKKESIDNRRKDLILGKKMSAADLKQMIAEEITSRLMTAEQLKRTIQDEIAKAPAKSVEHHWHQTNGWWWRPYWDFAAPLPTWKYTYTQQDPSLGASVYMTANSSAEMGNHLGLNANWVESKAFNLPETSSAMFTSAKMTDDHGGLISPQDYTTLVKMGGTPESESITKTEFKEWSDLVVKTNGTSFNGYHQAIGMENPFYLGNVTLQG
jgi:hypothetical protein